MKLEQGDRFCYTKEHRELMGQYYKAETAPYFLYPDLDAYLQDKDNRVYPSNSASSKYLKSLPFDIIFVVMNYITRGDDTYIEFFVESHRDWGFIYENKKSLLVKNEGNHDIIEKLEDDHEGMVFNSYTGEWGWL